ILFDNGVGELHDAVRRDRFERLVSEAATAAVDHLARGYEVELVTRERVLSFAAGHRQRLAVLELLATIEPGPRRREPLHAHDPRASQLRIHLDAGEERPAPPAAAPGHGAPAAPGASAAGASAAAAGASATATGASATATGASATAAASTSAAAASGAAAAAAARRPRP
ncbi:MAG TPA: hypothetical protein VHG32_21975, partial [Thermoanaerobaculia bacterium]|nr:hypothetical protein [Thermoanaerobaculia bacterium]